MVNICKRHIQKQKHVYVIFHTHGTRKTPMTNIYTTYKFGVNKLVKKLQLFLTKMHI